MKPVFVWLVGFLLIGIVFMVWQLSTVTPHIQQSTLTNLSPTLTPSPIPYTIESYRNRAYPQGDISIDRLVRETNTFRSYVVSYLSDGLKLYALMNIPTSPPPQGGFPVVIVNHGYIDPDVYSTENSYINTSAYFANNGFLVLKPDYRGHDESEGEARRFFSRIEYASDVAHLLTSLPSISQANTQKVFMYGHSMGGDVTLRILETSNKITGATLWAPAVTTFPESQLYFVRKNRANELSEVETELTLVLKPEEYDLVSTFAHLSYISSPLLIHHGTRDESVPYSWGKDLYTALQNAGKDVVFHTYEGDNHDIAGNFSRALARDVEFFRSLL